MRVYLSEVALFLLISNKEVPFLFIVIPAPSTLFSEKEKFPYSACRNPGMSAHVFVMNSIILAIGKLDTDSLSSLSPNSNDARAVWTTEKYTRKEQSNLFYSLLENVIFKFSFVYHRQESMHS